MRGACGTKGWFGQPLPCPYDGPAVEPETEEFRSLLVSVCGPSFAQGPVCCTSEQVQTLQASLVQAESFISPCPACHNNFRSFYCSFTCSQNQATFLDVTATQTSNTGQTAVKAVDFYVGEHFGEGFFNSCKDIKFGASNGYAMDFIGGGAKNYSAFLKYMGDVKDLGSPFQINYPQRPPPEKTGFNPSPRNCFDTDLSSHCSCIDCPSTCPVLPYVPPPGSEPSCQVGSISCLSFILILAYGLASLAFVTGYLIELSIRRRREKTYERVALSGDAPSGTVYSPGSHSRALVGASSLAQYIDGDDSTGGQSESRHLGRGASLLDPIETLQPRQYRLNTFLRRSFYRLGASCANHPWLTLCIVFTIIALLNVGWRQFEVETDPVRLWVSASSESKLQKEFFDHNFGPFYRTEQIFVTPTIYQNSKEVLTTSGNADEAALTWDRLQWWFGIEEDIRTLKSNPNGYTLNDICFKPAGPQGACVVQSISAWFDYSLDGYSVDTWRAHVQSCASHPSNCIPDFQQPLEPQYVLGGVPSTSGNGTERWLDARALIITYVVSDSLDTPTRQRAEEWERTLGAFMQQLASNSTQTAASNIVFSTGVSLEEELNKSTNTDIRIVVLSYVVMFIYVSLTLGNGEVGPEEEGVWSSVKTWVINFPRLFRQQETVSSSPGEISPSPRIFPRLPRRLFVGSKFTLGLFGIALVILSVSSSVGLFSLIGVKVTLIIAEVIPFLVLAVGVDNVFILVHELDRQNMLHGPNASAVAPGAGFPTPLSPASPSHRSPFDSMREESVDADSMPLHLAPEERVARTLAKMGPSILLSSLSETVAFALGALVPMPAVRNFALYAAGSVLLNASLQVTVFISALAIDLRRLESGRVDCFPCIKIPSRIALMDLPPNVNLGRIARFVRRTYAPFLMRGPVKGAVLVVFGGVFIASIISMQHIQLGLDQRVALPSDSYLLPYFDALDAYFDVGPPVYFVSHEINATSLTGQRNLCGRFTTCVEGSVANTLEAERNRTESSFISQPAASWIDDFLRWMDPALETCCRIRKSDRSQFCASQDSERLCVPCFQDRWNVTLHGMPEGGEFMRYLQQWLQSPTDETCPLGGKAAYSSAVSLNTDQSDIQASHFRTFHSPLKTQGDFINAFAAAHRIADDISKKTGMQVFPYSLFYVFFDQYAHIIATTQEVLGLGLASVLLVTALLLGSWRTGTIVTGVVALTVVNVMGVMGVWGISLNAISLVNLVISLGISVEFCSHIARAFMGAGVGLPVDHPAGQKERDERMWIALVDVGPSVLSGITFTKLIGISVLALTRSKLLEIYYFRMWLTLIISGALHGLVLLPAVLSLAGGPGYPLEDADEEWMSNAIRRHDYEYTPFLADDASDNSDNL
ncbi:multidrug efflux transporter AcrB transmembrane domain-containing protein [Ramaria rubella]|nr:multidrug efflux transporter AcrB transmembrane domain-containing protein [Ramaria rubella]